MKPKKFLIRLLIVFVVNVIIIFGDYSLTFFDNSARTLFFSLYFVSYWMLIWYFSAYINQKIKLLKDRAVYPYSIFVFNFIFGVIVAFFANYFYRTGDLLLYHNIDLWKDIPILNPELTISLFVLYMVVFIFDIYMQSILNKKENQLQLEKLKKENNLAKYLILKSQIEPHFLFNSLSVLSSIIYYDVNLASDFILRLSKILRYVIEKNDLLTVPLKDEIAFINDYFFLIKTRFDNGIIFENKIDKNIVGTSVIPPVSLQLLFENAIKHNKFTHEKPLKITIYNDDNYIVVENNIDIRANVVDSTKQGLDNLTKRFLFLSENPVKIDILNDNFVVSLPLLPKLSDYEL